MSMCKTNGLEFMYTSFFLLLNPRIECGEGFSVGVLLVHDNFFFFDSLNPIDPPPHLSFAVAIPHKNTSVEGKKTLS